MLFLGKAFYKAFIKVSQLILLTAFDQFIKYCWPFGSLFWTLFRGANSHMIKIHLPFVYDEWLIQISIV